MIFREVLAKLTENKRKQRFSSYRSVTVLNCKLGDIFGLKINSIFGLHLFFAGFSCELKNTKNFNLKQK
jgi:hypothetical protein